MLKFRKRRCRWRGYLSICPFFKHPLHHNNTTISSGKRLDSLLSCIFLEIGLDTIQTSHTNFPIPTINPMVIHRFNTFLGMRALCDRSDVSYLSRGWRTKRQFNRAKKRDLGSNFRNPEPNGSRDTRLGNVTYNPLYPFTL